MKRGDEVEVTFRGKMVGRPHKRLGIARVSVRTERGAFWAVVPVHTVKPVEEVEQQ